MPRLLKIGDFSQLAQVSTRTLRHYDQIGLLKPASTDASSDYRYYALEQLPRLNRILALKDLGLSLDQIAHVLRDDVTVEQLRDMLNARQREIEQHMRAEQERMTRVRAVLTRIEREGQPARHDVVLKAGSTCVVVTERRVVPSIRDVLGARRDMLSASHDAARLYKLELCDLPAAEVVIYHNDGYTEEDVDIEAGVCVRAPVAPRGEFSGGVRELPAHKLLAAAVHHGTLWQARDTLTALYAWLGENAFASSGPCREWHLSGFENDLARHDQPVTMEFQVPVQPLTP
jgi:DNA-binding transcriptional MerR regulator/effector-binding domain-containing protein